MSPKPLSEDVSRLRVAVKASPTDRRLVAELVEAERQHTASYREAAA